MRFAIEVLLTSTAGELDHFVVTIFATSPS